MRDVICRRPRVRPLSAHAKRLDRRTVHDHVAVAVDQWELAADAAARLVGHDKAYADAKMAMSTLEKRLQPN